MIKSLKNIKYPQSDEILVSSREAAEWTAWGDSKTSLMSGVIKDLDNNLKAAGFDTSIYWKLSTYISKKNDQEYTEYLITEAGCEYISKCAWKTEYKQQRFKDAYIKYFKEERVKLAKKQQQKERAYNDARIDIKRHLNTLGLTLTDAVNIWNDATGKNESLPNFSNKLRKGTIRYIEVMELVDALGYKIEWVKKQ